MNLQDHLEEIEILIENELGMERGELVKSLATTDKNYQDQLINYYSLEIFKNCRQRGEYFDPATFRHLIHMILMCRTFGKIKKPRPEEPFTRYDYETGKYFTPVPKDR